MVPGVRTGQEKPVVVQASRLSVYGRRHIMHKEILAVGFFRLFDRKALIAGFALVIMSVF